MRELLGEVMGNLHTQGFGGADKGDTMMNLERTRFWVPIENSCRKGWSGKKKTLFISSAQNYKQGRTHPEKAGFVSVEKRNHRNHF